MFEMWFVAQDHVDVPDMTMPDVIPEWLLETPPLPEPPCDCCGEQVPPDEPEPGWTVPGVTWDLAVPLVRPALSPAVLALKVAADQVCRLDPRSMSPEQALVDGEALLQVGQRLRVAEVRRLGDVRERELFSLTGHRPPVDLGLAARAAARRRPVTSGSSRSTRRVPGPRQVRDGRPVLPGRGEAGRAGAGPLSPTRRPAGRVDRRAAR